MEVESNVSRNKCAESKGTDSGLASQHQSSQLPPTREPSPGQLYSWPPKTMNDVVMMNNMMYLIRESPTLRDKL